jgi:hypothetical protein
MKRGGQPEKLLPPGIGSDLEVDRIDWELPMHHPRRSQRAGSEGCASRRGKTLVSEGAAYYAMGVEKRRCFCFDASIQNDRTEGESDAYEQN